MLKEALYLNHFEVAEWLREEPEAHANFNQAYEKFMPKFRGNVLKDPRFIGVDHVLNLNFAQNPVVLMGVIRKAGHPGVTISGLYTFPPHRRQGYARYLIDQIQKQTLSGYLQIAVERSKLDRLEPFYKSMGFQLAKGYSTDPNGTRLYDFFWSRQRIQIVRNGDDLSIRPLG